MKALGTVDFSKAEGFLMEWEHVNIQDHQHETNIGDCDIGDIEDVPANQLRYTDSATEFLVMTEIAHKNRRQCCGGGCRHCPCNHENVRDKARQIQQPAFLFEGNQASNSELQKYPLMPLNEAVVREKESENAGSFL
mmetsp:Transcript_29463/g.43684  ORF Transcript_29463/g.43684 Transcript_29463/m.43684 type:complete len:137 (-) Transcript_29463:64-474(-)